MEKPCLLVSMVSKVKQNSARGRIWNRLTESFIKCHIVSLCESYIYWQVPSRSPITQGFPQSEAVDLPQEGVSPVLKKLGEDCELETSLGYSETSEDHP